MKKRSRCYMCDKVATSREHVPPLCLFPETKDIKSSGFRKNLITVPSCSIHNSKKSDDDEFLLFSLSGLIKNNPVGRFHQLTKASRALERKRGDFFEKEILRNHEHVRIPTQDGKNRIVSIGNPNSERLLRCFKHIAYGLYYHEFRKKFDGKLQVILGFVEYLDNNAQTMKYFLKRRFEVEEKLNLEVKGDNRDIFYYQFHKPDEFGLIGLKMVFFGSAEAYFSFIEKDSYPCNLGVELISRGFPVTIKLPGEKFEFNK